MAEKTRSVFILEHVYEYGEDDEHEEIKTLGVYSNRQKAEEAINRYIILPGFTQYPRSCFVISKNEINKDQEWTEGFVSSESIIDGFKTVTSCINEWLNISSSAEDPWSDNVFYNAICEIDEMVYQSNNAEDLANHISNVWKERFPESVKTQDEYFELAKKILKALKLT